ncbi:MAG: hypothetical protein QM811_07025 [Pirellulales bacterium]
MAEVVYTTARSNRIRDAMREFPGMFSGRVPDRYGLVAGFKMRMAWSFTSTIRDACETKGRGRADEAGDSWKPLSKAYLAYQRPMEIRKGVGSRNPPRGGKWAPGGRDGRNNDGLLNEKQKQLWKRTFARTLARLQFTMDYDEAKRFAAAIAWNAVKKIGGKTKLDKFGSRRVQIGVNNGVLMNSLSPGQLTQSGPDATFRFDDPHGYVEQQLGTMTVGTDVPYAAAFHKQRPLWPTPEKWPSFWWDDWLEVALGGIRYIARDVARRGGQ